MTEQEGVSKMETVDEEKEMERFEAWLKGSCTFPPSDLFIDMTGSKAAYMRHAWLAAKKQAMEEMEVVGYQERIIDKEWNRPVCDWYPISKELYESPRDIPETCRMRYETRILYAKRGK